MRIWSYRAGLVALAPVVLTAMFAYHVQTTWLTGVFVVWAGLCLVFALMRVPVCVVVDGDSARLYSLGGVFWGPYATLSKQEVLARREMFLKPRAVRFLPGSRLLGGLSPTAGKRVVAWFELNRRNA